MRRNRMAPGRTTARSLYLIATTVCVLLAGLTVALPRTVAAPAGDEPRCEQCDTAMVDKLKVVVTDFAAQKDHLYCNAACAIAAMMDKFPTSRAVAHDPFAGKEVRIIRTGAKWLAWPTTAVFLYLPQAQTLDPPRRCLAFPRQDEYIQYLAAHPEVAAFKPRPLRLPELLKKIGERG